ncbi:unnamed protein product [Clavelina lepadiformis]|uniref:Transcription initiation factor TFIID subunit 10 n=1 Tax=Clavelina lepadiformis TaxID=159417 RepID=A0ABP0FHF2_CLALP
MNGIKTEKNDQTAFMKEEPMVEEEEEESQINVFNNVLQQMENYTPTIPDAVTEHFLNKAGVNSDDNRVTRLISLAAQKFIADIVNDTYQLSKMKGSAQTARSSKSKEKKMVLTMEDLTPVLAEKGIKVKKPAYYT